MFDSHLEVWQAETAVSASERAWMTWIDKVEALVGHSADIAGIPTLPYESGCKHGSPCANVFIGRACALDPKLANGYTPDGLATITYLADDAELGLAAGSVLLAFNPYTGKPSGQR